MSCTIGLSQTFLYHVILGCHGTTSLTSLSCLFVSQPTDPNFESQVTSKLCCYELVEILYSRLSKSELNTPESVINKAYVGGEVKTGKELTMALTK